ncbi:hypothetical protein OPQ81_005812 [Rhizoctonia solani]|nr:hypothetical protein OPQ81_005812 [Rhizoctonia solani]
MASVKLATLVIRTLAKPISAKIKQQAEHHESFKRICVSWAQWAHRTEVGLRTNLLGESAKHIKPLSETRAIQNGANSLAEAFPIYSRGEPDTGRNLADEVRELKNRIEAMQTGWEQKLEEENSRSNELSRILTRVVEIGLRGGWAEVVDQAPLKIPASVVKHADLPDPRTNNGGDGSISNP